MLFTMKSTLCLIADVDECHMDGTSSPCNAFAEYCINSIGSYACACKEDFTCGKYDGKHLMVIEFRFRQALNNKLIIRCRLHIDVHVSDNNNYYC